MKTLSRLVSVILASVSLLLLTTVGSLATAQTVGVSSGAPRYSYSVPVPPGIRNYQPSVTVEHSMGAPNGPLGYGWALNGISAVTRCPAYIDLDGYSGNISYTGTDKLCLNGQRLVQINSSGTPLYGPSSNDALGSNSTSYLEFRTEVDSYTRVRSYGYADGSTAASGPAWFRIWCKDGQILDFGASPNVNTLDNALIVPTAGV